MSKSVLKYHNPVIFVGAAPVYAENLTLALTFADVVVAADGGAQNVLNFGLMPDLVIGDFDSLPPEIAGSMPPDRLLRVAEQDQTDFEKCLTHVGAPLILAVGFSGARMDHSLVVLHALLRFHQCPVIVIAQDDVIFHAPKELNLDLAENTRVSLIPLQRVRGTSTGLKWPINGLAFQPGDQHGASNCATGRPIDLQFENPGMLVILPRSNLQQAIEALTG